MIDDFSGGLSGWLKDLTVRVLGTVFTGCAVSLPIYLSCIRKQRNLPSLTLAYLAGAGGLAAGYTMTLFIGITFVLQGILHQASRAGDSPWPFNSELNSAVLLVFMLSLFVALPTSFFLLNGIAGYTLGLASKNGARSLSVSFRGAALYIVLSLLFTGVNSNLVRLIAVASALLFCVRYISRTGNGSEDEAI